jgi:geranylgeranyl reductase family protein
LTKYDVIIIGSGTAGCLTAKTLSSRGFKSCLIDIKEKKDIGIKVCGDAIGKHHFDRLGIDYPKGKEKEGDISGIKVYSPDLKTNFRITDEGLKGFMINRYIFGQRLLKNALNEGSELIDSTRALRPIIESGFIRGVYVKSIKENSKKELRSKVTVDASGMSAVLRKQLPLEFGIETEISKEDQVVCYREIRQLNRICKKDFCEIYLDSEIAPGGYYWLFPEGKDKVNVGLGVAAIKNHKNPKNLLYKNILQRSLFESSKIIHGGGGIVPTRRPLNSFTGNGIVIVGDAACQVNPIHGGGIGSSMMGGKIAGEEIGKILEEKNEPSRESLWQINVRFMENYGAKQAKLDVFRFFLQGLSNDDLNFGMQYNLVKEEDVLTASMGGEIKLNISEASRRAFVGLGRLSFLKALYNMAKTIKKVQKIYKSYPISPKKMSIWESNVRKLFSTTKEIFRKK